MNESIAGTNTDPSQTISVGTQNERIPFIDAVRSFALAGIIVVHFVDQFNQLPAHEQNLTRSLLLDGWIHRLSGLFLYGKMYLLFSCLFGVSFWITREKALNKSTNFTLWFWCRTLVLFGLGMAHQSYYPDDFLVDYALLSPVLILTARLADRYVLLLACILLLHPIEIIDLFDQYTKQTSVHQNESLLDAIQDTHSAAPVSASFSIRSGVSIVLKWLAGKGSQTAGLFLVGMIMARHRALQSNHTIRWVLCLTGCIMLSILLYLTRLRFYQSSLDPAIGGRIDTILNFHFSIFMATSILSVLRLLWIHSKTAATVMTLSNVFGRMSLTHYLSHTLIGMFIFGTIGLGLAGKMGCGSSALMAIILILLQWTFSKIWIRHFKRGPLEALWRDATSKLCLILSGK